MKHIDLDASEWRLVNEGEDEVFVPVPPPSRWRDQLAKTGFMALVAVVMLFVGDWKGPGAVNTGGPSLPALMGYKNRVATETDWLGMPSNPSGLGPVSGQADR